MRHTLTPRKGQLDTFEASSEHLTAGYNAASSEMIAEALEMCWPIRDLSDEYPDPVLVAYQLKSLNVDASTLVSALLGSDVSAIESPQEIIASKFDAETAGLIDHVRRINEFRVSTYGSGNAPGAQDQVELLRRLLLSLTDDIRAILVKLAYRTQRLHMLPGFPESQARAIAQETLDIFAPLANRLGLGQIKWEMEDLCFRTLEPAAYKRLAKALEESRASRETYIRDFVSDCERRLDEHAFGDFKVFGRPKHIYSIWRKMKNKRIEFKDLFDVRAVRILVSSEQDCYAALGIVHSAWKPITREFDDYIAKPKENSYQSLHTAVVGPLGKPVEIQIRTYQMDQEAELGIAAHWSYKEGSEADAQLLNSINGLRQLLDDTDETLVEDYRQQVEADRVYVITPKGDVVNLINGSTPLDLAYHIHSDVGHRCRGAKVNGSIIPLTTKLTNGDQVEILTTREPSPSRDWLNKSLGFLQSSRARSKVRAWFNVQDLEQHLHDGRAILDRELRRAHSSIPIEKLTRALKFEKPADLYVALARNETSASQLATVLNQLEAPKKPELLPQGKSVERTKRNTGDISVSGVGSLLTQIANCCKPVPYDSIVGFITKGKGVSIHRADCSNILSLTEDLQARLIEVEWGDESSASYQVDLVIVAYDRQGLLRDVSTVLANEKVNVIGVNTASNLEDQTADMKLSIYVDTIESLSVVMEKLRVLRNVQSVQRVI